MKKNPNYREPSLEDVNRCLDECDYNYYLPQEIFQQLLHLCSYHLMGKTVSKILPKPLSDRGSLLYDFYTSLAYSNYQGNTPLRRSIFILKELSKTVDFRSLEKGIKVEQVEVENFREELDKVDNVLFKENIDPINMEDLSYVVSLSMSFRDSLYIGNDRQESEHKIRRTKSYNETLRTQKTSIARPDFKAKLVKKNLVFNSVDKKDIGEIVIFVEDVTNSMTKNKGHLISKAVERLLLKDDRIVHHYRFAGAHIELQVLENFEDKLRSFTEKKSYYDLKNDYNSLIKFLSEKYSNGNVILVTDGNDYVSKRDTSLIFNFLGISNNEDMRSFIKGTGGKYLLI